MPKNTGPRKNEDGRWYQQFRTPPNPHGVRRRIYVVCPPGNNTAKFCAELVRQAIERHVRGGADETMTFQKFTEERFFPEYPAARNLRPSSRGLLEYLLQKNAMPSLGSLHLRAVDAATVARLCALLAGELKDDGQHRYAAQTVRLTTIAIMSVLRWAHRTGQLAAVPPIVIPKVPEAQRPQPYTQDEAQKLIRAAKGPDELALFLLAFDAGLRKSEILGLSFAKCDFAKGQMLIDTQRYRGTLRVTKGGRARTVPMSPALSSALKAIRHVRGPCVFTTADGTPREETWIRGVFRRARTAANLRRVRWHDHRHTFSTMRTDDGVQPFALQALLGHRDVRTTQDYVHSSTGRLRSILDGGDK